MGAVNTVRMVELFSPKEEVFLVDSQLVRALIAKARGPGFKFLVNVANFFLLKVSSCGGVCMYVCNNLYYRAASLSTQRKALRTST